MRTTTGFLSLSFAVLLTGCEGPLRIGLPAEFHGHVSIACGENVREPGIELSIDASGKAVDAHCPARETRVVLWRGGKPLPETPHITWSTTGDGFVQAIDFTVP